MSMRFLENDKSAQYEKEHDKSVHDKIGFGCFRIALVAIIIVYFNQR